MSTSVIYHQAFPFTYKVWRHWVLTSSRINESSSFIILCGDVSRTERVVWSHGSREDHHQYHHPLKLNSQTWAPVHQGSHHQPECGGRRDVIILSNIIPGPGPACPPHIHHNILVVSVECGPFRTIIVNNSCKMATSLHTRRMLAKQ